MVLQVKIINLSAYKRKKHMQNACVGSHHVVCVTFFMRLVKAQL